MNLSELIRKREVATVTVATVATVTPIYPPSVATVASVNVANTKVVKLETLKDRQREASRQRAISLMNASPDVPRGIFIDDEIDPDNVIVFVASRFYQQTCELLIPKAKYDAWRMLELIERMGAQPC